MLSERLDNWLAHARKYFFTFKEGFFEVSYLDNSPEMMVKSMMRMPFVKHNEQEQTLHSNNVFFEGVVHYQELEEGLWAMYSDCKYKTNVKYKVIYDKFFPCNYHLLSFNMSMNQYGQYSTVIMDNIFINESWMLSKRKNINNSNLDILSFKNAHNKNVSIYFNEEWLTNLTLLN